MLIKTTIAGISIKHLSVLQNIKTVALIAFGIVLTIFVNLINEPPRGKTNNVVSDQVRHKSGCTVTEAG